MGADLKSVTASCTVLAVILLLCGGGAAVEEDENEFHGDYSKLSGIIIPGFASTQLRAWSILDCPYSPLDFNPLDLVWLDTTKVTWSSFQLFVSRSSSLLMNSMRVIATKLVSYLFVDWSVFQRWGLLFARLSCWRNFAHRMCSTKVIIYSCFQGDECLLLSS